MIRSVLTEADRARVTTAWQTAWLGRVADFPPLHALLGEDRPQQSAAAMASALDRWSVATAA